MAAQSRDLLREMLLREAKGLARGAQGLPAILKQKIQELDDNFRARIDPTWAFKVVANRWLACIHNYPILCNLFSAT